jgi:hypothetical protein
MFEFFIGVTILIIVIVLFLILKPKSTPTPTPTCQGPDKNGIYVKDSKGNCNLNDCISGWGINNGACVQDGTTCPGGTFLRGVCNTCQSPLVNDGSTECASDCNILTGGNLPYPMIGTTSTTPIQTVKLYKNGIDASGKKVCLAESCNGSAYAYDTQHNCKCHIDESDPLDKICKIGWPGFKAEAWLDCVGGNPKGKLMKTCDPTTGVAGCTCVPQ